MCWYMLVYTNWYILVYTSRYCAFRHKDFFEISKWIQHGTRQDNKVQESPGSMYCAFRDFFEIPLYRLVRKWIHGTRPDTGNTVQGRTRQDKEMPKSPVPLNEAVQEGT